MNFCVVPRRNLPLSGKCQIWCHLDSFSLSKASLSCDFGFDLFAHAYYLYTWPHDHHPTQLCREGDAEYNEGELSVFPSNDELLLPAHLQWTLGETRRFEGFLHYFSACIWASHCFSLWKHNSHSRVAIVQLCGAVMSPDPEAEIFSGWGRDSENKLSFMQTPAGRDIHKSVLI